MTRVARNASAAEVFCRYLELGEQMKRAGSCGNEPGPAGRAESYDLLANVITFWNARDIDRAYLHGTRGEFVRAVLANGIRYMAVAALATSLLQLLDANTSELLNANASELLDANASELHVPFALGSAKTRVEGSRRRAVSRATAVETSST